MRLNRRGLLAGLFAIAAAAAVPAKWAAAKVRGIFNVKDFGAKGDSMTDDFSAINAAMEAAAKNGGEVYLPAGTYRVGQPLQPLGVQISGAKEDDKA